MRILGLLLLIAAPSMAHELACGSLIGRVGTPAHFGPTVIGGAGPYTFSTSAEIPGLTFDPATGILNGVPTTPGHYFPTFKAADSGSVVEKSCGVTILPAGPAPSCALLPAAKPGLPYTGLLSPVQDGISLLEWHLVAGDLGTLTLSHSGVLSGATGSEVTATFAVSDILTRIDGSHPPEVTCTIPVITPLTLGCGTAQVPVNVEVNGAAAEATGGTPGYTFRYEGAAIPGLTFAADGSWSGTPTVPGDYTFVLKASDSGEGIFKQSAFSTCSLRVAPVEMQVHCDNLPLAYAGEPYSSAGVKVTGGIPPYRYSLETIPVRWLSLDSSTGILSGTPPMDLPFPFTIRVTDNGGVVKQSKTAACQVNTPQPQNELTAYCGSLPISTLDKPFIGTLLAQGGTPPYIWRLHESYVAGLELSTDGVWSGTPLFEGNFPFEAQVHDAKGVMDTVQCSVTIQKEVPPQIEAETESAMLSTADVTVRLGSSAPSRVDGSLAAVMPDGEAVQFAYAIDPGADSARVAVPTGSVAGDILLSVGDSASAAIRIARAAPRLYRSSVRLAGGDLQVMGVSNTRELLDADVTWTFADGSSRTVRYDLADLSAAWFGSEMGRRGVFEVSIPVEEGATGASIVVRNSEGGSEAAALR